MAEIADWVVAFVEANRVWAAPIVFVLAFGESLAFLSLLFPATVMLVGIGALIGAADLPFWP
ncbi:MAG: DedA family protein, partial [Azospirillum sp.]|nr:DedA family protein [Azospirillum sp.]